MSNIKVLALDLEGTLISTLGTKRPRPGLFGFLENCNRLFERIVIFTLVDEIDFKKVADILITNKDAPRWFEDMEYITFDGIIKDLRFIPNLDDITAAIIVDDYEELIDEDQKSQWIKIENFDYPYPQDDKELERVLSELKARS
jgi:protein-tyrosine phosphatase